MRWIEKSKASFLMASTSSISMQSLGKIVQRAPVVGAKTWCLYVFFVTCRMPRSGNLPVLFLLSTVTKNQHFAIKL